MIGSQKDGHDPYPLLHNDGVTVRAVLIGFAMIPVNVYLVVQWETVWGTQYPTTMAIFFNAVFCVLLAVLCNLILKKFLPLRAMSQGELLTIYIILLMAITVSGHDFSQSLFCTISTSHWFATPENEWASIFWRYVPTWLSVNDDKVLQGFYDGDSTLYTLQHIKGWLKPMFWWTLFLTTITFTTICVNVIIRKQWIEREKLTYPLTQLPYEMTRNDSLKSFFSNRLLLIGFGIAFIIGIINGLGLFSSVFPSIPLKYDLSPHFTDKPWDAMGITSLYVTPYAIGLAFPIPLDLLFSCWLFYLIWKLERIMGSMMGLNLPGYPFEDQQILGAYLGIAIVSIWMFRKPLWQIIKKVVGAKSGDYATDDKKEPMGYRSAVIGTIFGMTALVVFCYAAGMSVIFAIAFFVIYFVIAFAYTRMRAELGPPLQGIHYSGPLQFIIAMVGSRKISAQTLTVAAPFWTMTKEFRNSPTPFQLESFKLAERSGINTRKLWKIMMLSTYVGLVVTFWAFLQFNYKWGGVGGWRGVTAYSTIERWIVSPVEIDTRFLTAVVFGMVFVIVNTLLRLRFLWWSLHPLGYPLAGYYHFDKLWFPFFISWVVKWAVLKYGGIRAYRKAFPFFMGLILGDFVIGSLWGVIGLLTGKPTYAFKDW